MILTRPDTSRDIDNEVSATYCAASDTGRVTHSLTLPWDMYVLLDKPKSLDITIRPHG